MPIKKTVLSAEELHQKKEEELRHKLGSSFTPLFRILTLNFLAARWLAKLSQEAETNFALLSEAEMIAFSRGLFNTSHNDLIILMSYVVEATEALTSNVKHEKMAIVYRALLSPISTLKCLTERPGMSKELRQSIIANSLPIEVLQKDLVLCYQGLLRQTAIINEAISAKMSKLQKTKMVLLKPLREIQLGKLFSQIFFSCTGSDVIIGLELCSLEWYFSTNKAIFLTWKLRDILGSSPIPWNIVQGITNFTIDAAEKVSPRSVHQLLEYFRLDNLSRIIHSETSEHLLGFGIAAITSSILGDCSTLITYTGAEIFSGVMNWLELDKKAVNWFNRLMGYKPEQKQASSSYVNVAAQLVNVAAQLGTRMIGAYAASKVYSYFFSTKPPTQLVKQPDPNFVRQQAQELLQKQRELGLFKDGIFDKSLCKALLMKFHPDKSDGHASPEAELALRAIYGVC